MPCSTRALVAASCNKRFLFVRCFCAQVSVHRLLQASIALSATWLQDVPGQQAQRGLFRTVCAVSAGRRNGSWQSGVVTLAQRLASFIGTWPPALGCSLSSQDGFGYWWVSSSGFSFFHNDGWNLRHFRPGACQRNHQNVELPRWTWADHRVKLSHTSHHIVKRTLAAKHCRGSAAFFDAGFTVHRPCHGVLLSLFWESWPLLPKIPADLPG